MLVECPECKKQISDAAAACPNCGYAAVQRRGPDAAIPKAARAAPVFLITAAIALFTSLFTPRLILALPVIATVVLAIVSLVRKERFRGASIAVSALAVLLMGVNAWDMNQLSGRSSNDLSAAKIEDWNWNADPTFGGHGAIKWNVVVRNLSDRPIHNVKVTLATFDDTGKIITSSFSYVDAIPPGQTRSDDAFADYYGTEKKATITIDEVNFAQ